MSESTVADDLAFTALPRVTQDLILRLYGGTPDEARRSLEEALSVDSECDGDCPAAHDLADANEKLAELRKVLDT